MTKYSTQPSTMRKYKCKNVDDGSMDELEVEAASMEDAARTFAVESWEMSEYESAEVEVRGENGVIARYMVYAEVDVTFDIHRLEPA